MNTKMRFSGNLAGTFRRGACLLLALVFGGAIPATDAEDKATVLGLMNGDRPSGVLRTLDGKIFLGVSDPRPDAAGLTFRHAGGAARVLRERLSAADQKRFSLPERIAATAPQSEPPTLVSVGNQPPSPPLVLTFRVRTTLPPLLVAGPASGCDQGCGGVLSRLSWPAYWSRPHPGLAYPLFPCRQAAERDFLITTGILPRPRGVQTWRLR